MHGLLLHAGVLDAVRNPRDLLIVGLQTVVHYYATGREMPSGARLQVMSRPLIGHFQAMAAHRCRLDWPRPLQYLEHATIGSQSQQNTSTSKAFRAGLRVAP